ncbi:MAG: hypothetical protein RIR70_1573 [Pseudomonadota bacterium]|jgi:flagellar hook-associated protein 2
MATNSVGSGSSIIDVESIVSSLMQVERKRVTQLDVQIRRKDVEISAVANLKSKASVLEAALKKLETPATVAARNVASSDAALVTAEATASAALGDVEVKVVSTARATRVVAGSFASETALVGQGTLTLDVGKYTESEGVTTFAASATKSITVPANATLSDLKTLINDADAGMTASIVKTSDTYSLVVTASDTGLENAIRLSASDAQNLPGGGSPDFTSIAYSEADGEASAATLLQSAQNAVVYLDGLRVERASNTIDGAVAGLTFVLRKQTSLNDVSEATPVSISVSRKDEQIGEVMKEVVTAYNDLLSTYKSLSASSASADSRGVLNSDSTIRSMISRVRETLSEGLSYSVSDGNGGTTTSSLPMWKLGLELQRDGTLKLNETTLDAAIADGTASVLEDGVSVSAQSYLEDVLAYTGQIAQRTSIAEESQRQLEKRKADLEERLKMVETNYRQRYAALDAMLTKLNGVNNSVTQLMDQLNAQYKN